MTQTTVTIELTPSEEFHGLKARPFSLTPDLRFTFQSHSHAQAMEQIGQALKRREGLVVVTGEVGTGKTMLCRALLDTFETRTFLSVILDPLLTVEDLLHQVLTDFGLISARDRSLPPAPLTEIARHDLVATLQKFLASLVPLNAHAVIMIDEAQHLTGPVLEQVRLLSNFETDSAKLLQIVLVGQPNLDILLQRPDMRQLNQRVARRCELEPLSSAEVSEYIDRRLLVASEDPSASTGERNLDLSSATPMVHVAPAAAALVATISGGIPRLVNTLCDRALEAAYEARSHVVDRKAVLIAADRLRLPVPAQRWSRGRRLTAALVLLVAALAAWWWSERRTSPPATPPPAVAPAPPPVAEAPAVSTPPPSVETPAAVPAPSPTPSTPAPQGPTPSVQAPAPASASVASTATAPTAVRYEITAASFRTEERAMGVAGSLENAGLPVEARLDATGQWYRVVVGPFASMEEARAAQERLVDRGFSGTRIYSP